VLQERDTRDARLTDDLRAALREWVTVAETVRRSGDAHELDLLRRRGRQLALRVSDVLGRPVEFVDPVSGEVESIRVEALRASAIVLRRLRRYEEAAAAWRDLLSFPQCSPAYAREASEALAVHHEHRARDLEMARTFALQSLSLHGTAARQQATRHRLARLDRKLGCDPPSQSAALF